MSKFIKITLYALLAFVVFFAAAITILLKTVDLDTMKQEINTVLTEQAHTQIEITGPIKWSFFPWVGVRVKDIRIVGNHMGKADVTPLIRLKEADVSIRLMPLFIKHIELGGVKLLGLNLNLHCNAAGLCNWDFPKDTNSSSKPASEHAGGDALTVGLENLHISDAVATYQNDQTGAKFEFEHMGVHANNISLGKPFTVLANVRFKDLKHGYLYQADFTSLVDFKESYTRYLMNNLRLKMTIAHPAWGKRTVAAKASMNLSVLDEIDVQDFVGVIAQTEIKAKLHAKHENPYANLEGEIQLGPFSPRALASELGIPLVGYPAAGLSSADLNLKVAKGVLTVKGTLDKQKILANLTIPSDCLSRGECGYNPILTTIKIDALNLDNYMPKAKPVHPKEKGDLAPKPPKNQVKLKLSKRLQMLAFKGSLDIGTLQIKHVKMTDLHSALSGAGGVWNLVPLNATMYRGEVDIKTSIDFRQTPALARADLNVKMVNIGDMLSDMTGKKLLSAPMMATMQIQSHGLIGKPMLSTLKGHGKIVAGPGVLTGINLGSQILNANAPGSSPNPNKDETAFEQLGGSFIMKKGILTTPDIFLNAKTLAVNGQGEIVFPEWRIDSQLEAKTSIEGTELNLPIKVSGSLSDPSVRFDIARKVGQLAKKTIKSVLSSALDALGR